MELKQLEGFVKVVEMESFSKAAQALYLTQPTISVHIVSLEKELNTKLLDRTTKTVKTTKAGERLYEYAKSMLEIREDILQEFYQERPIGDRLLIAGSTIPSQHILPEIIPEFQKLYMNTTFSINQGDSEYVIEEILRHKVDIGFVGMKKEDSRLYYIPFYEDSLVIIAPNNEKYRQLKEANTSLEELMKQPIILRESGSGTQRGADRFLNAKNIDARKLNIVGHMNDQEIIKRSVSNGMGISIISKKSALDYEREGKILLFDLEENKITRKLYIVFDKRKRLSRMERAFVEFCTGFYKEIQGEKEVCG
ncbi:MAG: LysR family transcriptional regulator, transcriptional activator of the cysJI operon [Clostridiales bacterium]|nr:LysR family transcriptional regulator, transcriptional activator of the cysJI operon [Clostridiales bacterium]